MRFSKSGAFVGGVVFTLVIGGGTAMAAGTGSLLLGKGNTSTATTGLANSKGTPLSLAAKKGTPPLKVNNTIKVKNLDSDLLDGKDSTAFLPKAGTAANSSLLAGQPASAFLGAGATAANSSLLAGQPASAYVNTLYIASTDSNAIPPDAPILNPLIKRPFDVVTLPAGTYLLTFTGDLANTDTTPGNFGCQLQWTTVTTTHGFYANASLNAATASQSTTFAATTVSEVVTLGATGYAGVSCYVNSGDSAHTSYVYNSTLTATPVQTLHAAP